jgi:hypothetical protein
MNMKIKAIVMALALSLVALVSPVLHAELASSTDSLYPLRFDQLTYGQSPVWKVTNYSPTSTYVVRFVQPSGFSATLVLTAGESTSLGNFEPFHEFSCSSGYTPKVVATNAQPVYADYVAGNATHCSAN